MFRGSILKKIFKKIKKHGKNFKKKILRVAMNMGIFGTSTRKCEWGETIGDMTHEKKYTMITKMKIDLPTYSDKHDIESFLDWVKNTEIFLNYMDTPE